MKNLSLVFAFLVFLGGKLQSQTTTTIMDGVVYYDGYAGLVNESTPANVIRLRNDLATKKLTQSDLDAIGQNLTVNVVISALCDNYDRIGNVNIALVPKGSASYHSDSVQKIEIGRFITPFMNKNINPTSVPYSFSVDNVAALLKNAGLLSNYDFWLELQVFGVPYAANNEISGCSGRNDVFSGKVEFVSTNPSTNPNYNAILYPMSFQHYLNNYQEGASDAIGTTEKTFEVTVTETLYDAKLHLITSNHGANQGGEEYVRRWHRVFFDQESVLLYRPGGKSCEPYRMYNTQGNGIYGQNPRPENDWTSWNNWCPGDVIPTRIIELGTLQPGTHTFKITVAGAEFVDGQGYIPVSVYLQGLNEEVLGLEEIDTYQLNVFPNPSSSTITIESTVEVQTVSIFNTAGQLILNSTQNTIDVHRFEKGLYYVEIQLINGVKSTLPFLKNE